MKNRQHIWDCFKQYFITLLITINIQIIIFIHITKNSFMNHAKYMPIFDLFQHLIKALFILKDTVNTNFLTNVMLRGTGYIILPYHLNDNLR